MERFRIDAFGVGGSVSLPFFLSLFFTLDGGGNFADFESNRIGVVFIVVKKRFNPFSFETFLSSLPLSLNSLQPNSRFLHSTSQSPN